MEAGQMVLHGMWAGMIAWMAYDATRTFYPGFFPKLKEWIMAMYGSSGGVLAGVYQYKRILDLMTDRMGSVLVHLPLLEVGSEVYWITDLPVEYRRLCEAEIAYINNSEKYQPSETQVLRAFVAAYSKFKEGVKQKVQSQMHGKIVFDEAASAELQKKHEWVSGPYPVKEALTAKSAEPLKIVLAEESIHGSLIFDPTMRTQPQAFCALCAQPATLVRLTKDTDHYGNTSEIKRTFCDRHGTVASGCLPITMYDPATMKDGLEFDAILGPVCNVCKEVLGVNVLAEFAVWGKHVHPMKKYYCGKHRPGGMIGLGERPVYRPHKQAIKEQIEMDFPHYMIAEPLDERKVVVDGDEKNYHATFKDPLRRKYREWYEIDGQKRGFEVTFETKEELFEFLKSRPNIQWM